MAIQLNKETTVNLALFEAFAEFMAKIEGLDNHDFEYIKLLRKDRIPDTKRNIFFCYVGQNLLNSLGTKTVTNIFSGAPIDNERFSFFCRKFQELYENLSQEDQTKYNEIKKAFIEWRDKLIDKTDRNFNFWEAENFDKHSEKENIIDETAFINSVKIISDYYSQSAKLKNNEGKIFRSLKKLIAKRNDVKNSEKLFVERMYRINQYFKNNLWIMYELSDEKIIRRQVKFENKFDKTDLVFRDNVSVGIEDSKLLVDYRCEYNLLHNYISIEPIISNPSGTIPKFEYFTFSFTEEAILPRVCIGHKISGKSEGIYFEASPIVLLHYRSHFKGKNDSSSHIPYVKLKINDTRIPPSVRRIFEKRQIYEYQQDYEIKPAPFLFKEITFDKLFDVMRRFWKTMDREDV